MKAKYKLKMKTKQLDRAIASVDNYNHRFEFALILYNKAKGTNLQKRAFNRKEMLRSRWWKEIDVKVALEQEIKLLKIEVIKDSLEEIK